jgi:hypothetical protein
MPPNGNGQVSELDPHAETLTLVYQSAIDNPALDMPDNMVIALRTGDLFLSEDNGANNHIRGLTEDGLIFDFAEAKTNPTEFCGVCFDGNGNMMYVNQQGNQEESGVTYAIWGAVEPSVTSRLKGTPESTSESDARSPDYVRARFRARGSILITDDSGMKESSGSGDSDRPSRSHTATGSRMITRLRLCPFLQPSIQRPSRRCTRTYSRWSSGALWVAARRGRAIHNAVIRSSAPSTIAISKADGDPSSSACPTAPRALSAGASPRAFGSTASIRGSKEDTIPSIADASPSGASTAANATIA